ncbi:MAG: PEP-CTERM sorting domain-containing protein [Terriglobales bacterium]
MKLVRLVGLLLLSSVVAVLPASADLLSGCDTCQGATYLLQYNPNNTTTSGSDHIYDVFLTIDTSLYNGGGTYLNSVAIKIANSDDFALSSLLAAPGGIGAWSLQDGGLNANGCSGSGSGFICAQDGQTAPVPHVGSYTWEFHYATTSALLTGTLAASIKAQYVDANGKKVGALVSEGITLQETPEPASMLLIAAGAFGLFGILKLRK